MRTVKLFVGVSSMSVLIALLAGCGPAGEPGGEAGTATTQHDQPMMEETSGADDAGSSEDDSSSKVTTAAAVNVEFTGIADDGTCEFEMRVDGVDTEDVTLHLDSANGATSATWALVGGASKAWAILRPNDLKLCMDNLTDYHIKGVKGFEITAAGTTQSTSGMASCLEGTYPYDLRARIGDKFCGADPRVLIAD